jgi:predicted DNA-binding ribbon-helix-helix protein
MPSTVIKRSIAVAGHKTSISLEDVFWAGLKQIAADSDTSLSNLVNKIDSERINANLSSALRVFVFQHFCGGQSNGRDRHIGGHAASLP